MRPGISHISFAFICPASPYIHSISSALLFFVHGVRRTSKTIRLRWFHHHHGPLLLSEFHRACLCPLYLGMVMFHAFLISHTYVNFNLCHFYNGFFIFYFFFFIFLAFHLFVFVENDFCTCISWKFRLLPQTYLIKILHLSIPK